MTNTPKNLRDKDGDLLPRPKSSRQLHKGDGRKSALAQKCQRQTQRARRIGSTPVVTRNQKRAQRLRGYSAQANLGSALSDSDRFIIEYADGKTMTFVDTDETWDADYTAITQEPAPLGLWLAKNKKGKERYLLAYHEAQVIEWAVENRFVKSAENLTVTFYRANNTPNDWKPETITELPIKVQLNVLGEIEEL